MIKLSATAIDNFQACNIRWLRSNVQRIRKDVQTTALRRGTSWHKLHELNVNRDDQLAYINEAYETVPEGVSRSDWLIERIILMYSIIGFDWYFESQGDEFEIIANELEFEMPLYDAEGNEIEGVIVVGKIDQILRDKYGNIYVREFKSSSKSLDDSYWSHLNLDPQVGIYILAINWMKCNGMLKEYGIEPDDSMITKVMYNVWHKPGIGPKFLTQKDSKEFVETGKYCDVDFEVQCGTQPDHEPETVDEVYVDGEGAILTPGKKEGTYAIYETPEMFGARLLQDMYERPEFYFQQRELCRTPKEMIKFEQSLINMVHMMNYQLEYDLFYPCDKQCRARFNCSYIPLCEHNVEVDPENPPEGFSVVPDNLEERK